MTLLTDRIKADIHGKGSNGYERNEWKDEHPTAETAAATISTTIPIMIASFLNC